MRKEAFYMGFLSWIGTVVILFWILGVIFSIGGLMIHWLLIIAAIAFIGNLLSSKGSRKAD